MARFKLVKLNIEVEFSIQKDITRFHAARWREENAFLCFIIYLTTKLHILETYEYKT